MNPEQQPVTPTSKKKSIAIIALVVVVLIIIVTVALAIAAKNGPDSKSANSSGSDAATEAASTYTTHTGSGYSIELPKGYTEVDMNTGYFAAAGTTQIQLSDLAVSSVGIAITQTTTDQIDQTFTNYDKRTATSSFTNVVRSNITVSGADDARLTTATRVGDDGKEKASVYAITAVKGTTVYYVSVTGLKGDSVMTSDALKYVGQSLKLS